MRHLFTVMVLTAFVLTGAGCFGGGDEVIIEDVIEDAAEEVVDAIPIHPAAEVIGAWHVSLTDPDAPGVPPDFAIEGDIIFHTDYTMAGKFETSDLNTGTFTYNNGQVHAVADNGSIEFFASVTGNTATGTWHNLVSDIWGVMNGTRIMDEVFSL